MFAEIMMFVTLFLGLFLSFGADVWSFVLQAVGSFERISLFSIVGTALIAVYWMLYAVSIRSTANDNSQDKIGIKGVVFGVTITALWMALFIVTDMSAVAANDFAEWRAEKAAILQIIKYVGNLLLAFSLGMIFSTYLRNRKNQKSRRGNSARKASSEEPKQSK